MNSEKLICPKTMELTGEEAAKMVAEVEGVVVGSEPDRWTASLFDDGVLLANLVIIDEVFPGYIRRCKQQGMKEADIAKSLGVPVSRLRRLRHENLLRLRKKEQAGKKEEEA